MLSDGVLSTGGTYLRVAAGGPTATGSAEKGERTLPVLNKLFVRRNDGSSNCVEESINGCIYVGLCCEYVFLVRCWGYDAHSKWYGVGGFLRDGLSSLTLYSRRISLFIISNEVSDTVFAFQISTNVRME